MRKIGEVRFWFGCDPKEYIRQISFHQIDQIDLEAYLSNGGIPPHLRLFDISDGKHQGLRDAVNNRLKGYGPEFFKHFPPERINDIRGNNPSVLPEFSLGFPIMKKMKFH